MARRVSAATLGCAASVVLALILFPGVAFAHVEVEAEPAIAGSTNATVTFSAEAESATAGIESVRIVLPAGILPAEVALADGPSGWTLTPTSDGYSVGGAALPVREEAVHSVTIARLPDETRLIFKALVTYANGDVDRWIEEPTAANPEPQNPAPVLELQPGPRPGGTTDAPATTVPPPPGPSGGVAMSTGATAPADGGGLGWIWLLIGGVVLLGAAAAWFVAARRRASEG
jgi:uncharacterized protein YcnI